MNDKVKGSPHYQAWYTEWNTLADITGQLSELQIWDRYQASVTKEVLRIALNFRAKEENDGKGVTLQMIHAEVLKKLGIEDQLFARMGVQQRLRAQTTPVNKVGAEQQPRGKNNPPLEVDYVAPARNPRAGKDEKDVEGKGCGKKGHTKDKCHKEHPHLFDAWVKEKEARTEAKANGKDTGRKNDKLKAGKDGKDGKKPVRTCWICSEFKTAKTAPDSLLHTYADCPRKKIFDAKDKKSREWIVVFPKHFNNLQTSSRENIYKCLNPVGAKLPRKEKI